MGADSTAQKKRYKLKEEGSRMILLRRTLRARPQTAAIVHSLKVPSPPRPQAQSGGSVARYYDLLASTIMTVLGGMVLGGLALAGPIGPATPAMAAGKDPALAAKLATVMKEGGGKRAGEDRREFSRRPALSIRARRPRPALGASRRALVQIWLAIVQGALTVSGECRCRLLTAAVAVTVSVSLALSHPQSLLACSASCLHAASTLCVDCWSPRARIGSQR